VFALAMSAVQQGHGIDFTIAGQVGGDSTAALKQRLFLQSGGKRQGGVELLGGAELPASGTHQLA
jgi:hypothetical protein